MAANPQTDLAAFIAANVAGLASSSVFEGEIIPTGTSEGGGSVPDVAAFVLVLAGAPPKRMHDGTRYRQSLLHVTVRSAVDDPDGGKVIADAAFAALDQATISADYVPGGCEATTDAFTKIGTDEIGHALYAAVFRLIYVN